ncbi:MAG: aminopeptidase P family protein, partial [Chloroflexota bacterium]
KLEQSHLDAIVVSQPDNRRYLSGFTGSAGFLAISQELALLATDFRYIEQAATEAPDFEIARIEGDRWFPEVASRLRVKRLAFEAADISFATYQKLIEGVAQIGSMELLPTTDMVESLRAMKDEQELARIADAVALADAAFENVVPTFAPGMTEKEAAWKLEKFLREKGGERVSFDIIVAPGPSSALPHARPSDRQLRPSEPIIIDMGAQRNGYCSDLSRTIFLDEPDETFSRVYDIVLGAQLTALATISAGMNGEQADAQARVVIEQAGYGDAFGHGLGHGIGLSVHEKPRLGRGSVDTLSDGMVFTIEPGIYISGWGGVRIEDVVVLGEKGVRSLTKANKTDFGGKAR